MLPHAMSAPSAPAGNGQAVTHPGQVEHYRYIDGIPQLLTRLKAAGYDLHAMSNYPIW